jgi:putative membrane-bound dehydrogenase-like protein
MQVSRLTVVMVVVTACAAAFLGGACASKSESANAKPQAAVVASTTLAARPKNAPPARPPSRPTTSTTASTRPTPGPSTRPTTRPMTRPMTGPTEQSAAGVVAPPAPALSPEVALKTFTLAPGFRMELVAAEPLIQDPVVIAFDADGRVWAAEMTSYMPDAYGHGEDKPDGRIVILEDTDGDGRLDKRSVWLDGLVLPRALLPLRDGALVGAPPNLWFWRDTDGDGKADQKTLIATDFGNPKQNPEHQANGLLLALDNWVYTVNYDKRFRWVPDEEAIDKGDKLAVKWVSSRIPSRGQWGQSMDDRGRLYHNDNSDYLRADIVPPHYYPRRNPHYTGQTGVNVQLDKSQLVWPIRPTPAVNRGYRTGFLRADGSLKEFTAACGPCVYRGGVFPINCDGDVFVCEPSAHVVRRAHVFEDGLQLRGRNAYDRREFIASTDERFRPVNLNVGPDGALYVLDLYRGILQHNFYLTGYLRELALRRDMEQPLHMGRIYRVVHELTARGLVEPLSRLSGAQLVEKLSDPNGWVRDTAQRLIVERGDRTVLRQLRELVQSAEDPRIRVHALWTLEGLNGLNPRTLLTALDGDPETQTATVRLSERFLAAQTVDGPPLPLLRRLTALAETHGDPHLRLQCAFTLSAVDHPDALRAVADQLADAPDDKLLRDAALSGLAERELRMLERLVEQPSFAKKSAGRDALLSALAGCVLRERNPARVARALELATADTGEPGRWRRAAILGGLADAAKKMHEVSHTLAIRFDAEPAPLAALAASDDSKLAEFAKAIEPVIRWPGKAEEKEVVATPLTPDQQKLFDEGKVFFGATCAACHQPSGEGLEGKAPPLRGSPWLLGSDARVVRIVLNGVKGPIHVRDEMVNMEMPSLGVLDDRQVASILTYARREWGHTADPVAPDTVARVRKESTGRPDAWTEGELLKVK